MILSDETLRDELVRRAQLSGHDPTCVKVDMSVLKLDRTLRPNAVALVVEGPVGAIDEIVTAILAMARKLNDTSETKSIGSTPDMSSATVNLSAAAAHVDAMVCCGFHATGGHAQDRHGRDSAHVVYRVVSCDPRVDWIAPFARTSAITGGECSTCLHSPPLHEVWCATLHEPVTLAGAQAMLKEVQEKRRGGDGAKSIGPDLDRLAVKALVDALPRCWEDGCTTIAMSQHAGGVLLYCDAHEVAMRVYSKLAKIEPLPYAAPLRALIGRMRGWYMGPATDSCGCYECTSTYDPMMKMIVCSDCGNKRCPKSTHHDNECTNSNEAGQPGSRYK